MGFLRRLYILLLLGCVLNCQASPVIQLYQGELRGKLEAVDDGQDVEVYLGIPYAEPPVGDLRFAAPKPAKPWTGSRDATRYAAICPQGPSKPEFQPIPESATSEDCLFLNVFRPANTTSNHRLPVMVYIHGGGYYQASGNYHHGSVLASHNDVIIVTINYRLALLGFLNIPGTELQGNYGMLDQVEALKWVQQNIGHFGGNSSHVTIFGVSAGAASVGLHIISPMSAGLFHYAILEGGSAVTPFGVYTPKTNDHYDVFIKRLGCTDKTRLLSCLRGKSVEDFIQAQGTLDWRTVGVDFPAPTVDEEFLPDDPINLLDEGKFNKVEAIMIGVNKNEGQFLAVSINPTVTYMPPSIEAFHKGVREVSLTQNGECEIVKEAIIHHYTNHSDPADLQNLWQGWQSLMTDSFFFGPAVKSANSYTKAGIPTYFYHFSHRSAFTVLPPWIGVCHFEQVQYVFGLPWGPNSMISLATKYSDMEKGLSSYMMKLWTGFAKNSIPNDLVTWPRYTTETQEYLDISLVPSIRSNLHTDRMAFWLEFVPQLKRYCPGRGEASVPSSRKEIKTEL